MKEKNPIDRVRFYRKRNADTAVKITGNKVRTLPLNTIISKSMSVQI